MRTYALHNWIGVLILTELSLGLGTFGPQRQSHFLQLPTALLAISSTSPLAVSEVCQQLLANIANS